MDPLNWLEAINTFKSEGGDGLSTREEVIKYAFFVLMPLKTLAFDIGIYGYIKRYYQTYKTFN